MATTSTAIVGGTVVDVRTGRTTADAVVLIEGDRIRGVGAPDRVRVPPGSPVVDASRGWVVPGLTDMHVHARWPRLLPLFLAHGVTTIRDVGGSLARGQLLREELASGRRMGPRLFIAGPILDGVPPLWPDTTVLVDTVARAEAAVRFLAANGVDVIKVYNSVPEVSLVAIVRTAHELGLPVTGHVPRSLTMTRAIEIGIDGLEHIRVTGREMLPADEAATLDYLPVRRREGLLWDRFDPDSPRFEELARRIADARVFLDPTFVVDAEPLRDEAERAEAERMDHLPSWVSDAVGEAMARRPADVRRVMETPAEVLGAARSGFRKRQRFVGMCARAGARIVSGTDHVGPGDDLPGRGIQRELAYLVESGLSTAAALRASTLDAAASLGSENDLGAVEPGRLADLLVLDADPLADIANVARIRTVVHGGRVATPTEILAKPPAEPEAPYAT